MGMEELPSCPFCDYTDRDHYFLLQHVEIVHPEGISPFAVNGDASQQTMDSDPWESARESSSEYIECQCGEFCVLAEFESHLEMHYAEGTGFDETERTSPELSAPFPKLHHQRTASPAMEISAPLTLQSAVSGSGKSTNGKSAVKYRSRNMNQRSQNPVLGFIDVLRHSNVPPPRTVAQTSRSEGPRRLGVSTNILVCTETAANL